MARTERVEIATLSMIRVDGLSSPIKRRLSPAFWLATMAMPEDGYGPPKDSQCASDRSMMQSGKLGRLAGPVTGPRARGMRATVPTKSATLPHLAVKVGSPTHG